MQGASLEKLGRFAVRRKLGEGGSGVVYEVEYDDSASRVVALKVLRAELATSAQKKRSFLLEAERMARLSHPSLVPVLESGFLPDGRPYLAMPLLAGETAGDRIARGPLPVDVALHVFGSIASALEAVHEAGLVHRDVKPDNIFLVDDPAHEARPHATLLDFGIAREVDAAPSTSTIAGVTQGTAAYMAPERFFGSPATVRSDVYELGVTLYVLLTASLPWKVDADATDRLDPPDPRSVRPEISVALSAVILKALSTRPEKRPSSVAALALAVVQASSLPDLAAAERQTADVDIAPRVPERPAESRTTTEVTMISDGAQAQARSRIGAADPTRPLHVRAQLPAPVASLFVPPVTDPPLGGSSPRQGVRVMRLGAVTLLAILILLAVSGLAFLRGARSPAVVAAPEPSAPAPLARPAATAPSVTAGAADGTTPMTPNAAAEPLPPASNIGASLTPQPAAARSASSTRRGPGAAPASPSREAAPPVRRREDWYEDRQ